MLDSRIYLPKNNNLVIILFNISNYISSYKYM